MSYTAQLLERLNRDSSFVATPYRTHALGQSASSLSGSHVSAAAPVTVHRAFESPAFTQSSLDAWTNGQHAYLRPARDAELPASIVDCHSIISEQRGQIAQLNSRLSSLDEAMTRLQNARPPLVAAEADHSPCRRRESDLQSQLNERDAALAGKQGEMEQMRRQLQGQAQELQQLQDEKLRLSQQVLEAARKVEEVRAAAERDKAELAFRLGRQAATAALAATVTASMQSEASLGRESRQGTMYADQRLGSPSSKPGAAASLASPSAPAALVEGIGLAEEGSGGGSMPGHGFEAPSTAASSPRYTTLGHSGEDAASVAPDHVVADEVPQQGPPALSAPLSPSAQPQPVGGSTPTPAPSPPPVSTTALLARHEQLRQQELLLMALKQQQSTNRMLMLQQQRAMAGGGMGMGMGMGYGGDPSGQQPATAYGTTGMGMGLPAYSGYVGQLPASQALQMRALAGMRRYSGMPGGGGGQVGAGTGLPMGMGGTMSAAAMQGMARLQAQGAYQQQMQQQGQAAGGGLYGVQGGVGGAQGGQAGVNMGGTGYLQGGHSTAQQQQQQLQQQQQHQMQQLQQQTAALQSAMSSTGTGAAHSQHTHSQGKLPPGSPMGHMPANPGQGQQTGLAATIGHITDGPHGRSPEQLGLQVDDAGRPSIRAWDQLPPGYTSVVQFPYEVEPDSPCGGYTVYMHPPSGMAWPSKIPFFAPLLEPGIPFLKHGRTGFPHKRLLWMDISDPADPVLVWHEGAAPDHSRVKEKDKLRLIDILDIKAGRMSPVLQRSGNEANAGKYMCFSSDGRTLDVEFASSEMRDWAFKKFAELFAAYAAAQVEKLKGDAITLRVLAIMDNGQDPKVRPQEPPKPAGVNPNLAARAAAALGARPGGLPMPYGQGRPGMPGQAPYGAGAIPMNM